LKKAFVSNLILLLGANVLIKPIFIFWVDRSVQNHSNISEYGLYFTFFSFAMILSLATDFGIQTWYHKTIANDNALFNLLFPKVLLAKLISSLLYIGLLVLLFWGLNYDKLFFGLFLTMILWQLISSWVLLLRSNVSGFGQYKSDVFFSVLDKFLLICIFAVYFLFHKAENFDTSVFASWQLSGSIFLLLLLFIWSALNLPWRKMVRPKFYDAFEVTKSSSGFALVILCMLLYQRADSIILERFLMDGSHQAGIYAAAYRLIDAMNMLGFLAAGLLLPMFASLERKHSEKIGLFDTSFRLLWWFVLVATVPICFNSQLIMSILYHNPSKEWGWVLSILVWSFVFMTMTYVSGTYLTAEGKVQKLWKLYGLVTIFSMLTNIVIVKKYGLFGVCTVSVISNLLVFGIQTIFAIQDIKWPEYRVMVTQCLLYLIFAIIGVWILSSLFYANSLSGLITSFIFVSLLGVMTKVVSIRSLTSVYQNFVKPTL
jgi:O-antigen/teichoic acid export membrane protein